MKKNLIIIIAILMVYPLFSRENSYTELFEAGRYEEAVENIRERLEHIYLHRSHDRRVPTEFDLFREAYEEDDLMELFRQRKAEHFFIEDNPELHALHIYAGRSYYRLKKYRYSLNHYIQALRFKQLEPGNDDYILHEKAGVYRELGHFRSYIATLENAYSLNPENLAYSLELARALYPTADRRRAIFHLERYISLTSDDYDPSLLLMLANMNEDAGRYLETGKYYIRYLEKNPDDPYVNFALGHNALFRTGDFTLARECLSRALELLPEEDILRRAKSHEYIADISFKERKIGEALNNYLRALEYQNMVEERINNKKSRINDIREEINLKRAILLREQIFREYEEYETLKDELGREELELRDLEHEFRKLGPGRVRWMLAECSERLEQLEEAVEYYRMVLRFNYRANEARDRITKIELKIHRGY